MNEKRLEKYLKTMGCTNLTKWTIQEIKEIIKEVSFEGEETGYIRFDKDGKGRRYIQFKPRRFFIDAKGIGRKVKKART